MSTSEFSAIGAMSALRDQLEDRLRQNEDFRALKALERAILDVTAQLGAGSLTKALGATESTMILPGPGGAALVKPPSSLLHRLSGNYGSTATATVTPQTTAQATVANGFRSFG